MSQVSKSSMNNLSPTSSIESAIPRSSIIDSESRSPDPEVIEIATRRQFSASEKRMLLAEADRCKERGELGAFLRRKRIYSSMLSSWRKQLGAADQRGSRTATTRTEARCGGSPDQTFEPRYCPPAAQPRAGGADHRRPKKTVRGTRPADRGRDERERVMARRQRIGLSGRHESGLQGVRVQPRVCVPRSRSASWCLHATPRIGAAGTAAGLLHRRAGASARRARQRAVCRHGAGDDLCHIAR